MFLSESAKAANTAPDTHKQINDKGKCVPTGCPATAGREQNKRGYTMETLKAFAINAVVSTGGCLLFLFSIALAERLTK